MELSAKSSASGPHCVSVKTDVEEGAGWACLRDGMGTQAHRLECGEPPGRAQRELWVVGHVGLCEQHKGAGGEGKR